MTTTVRAYLDLSNAVTAEIDSRVNLDVLAADTRVVVSGRISADAKHADALGLAVRNAIYRLDVARRDARICRPERREHFAAKAAEAFESLVSALIAAGVPAK